MISVVIAVALAPGPSFAEKTGTSRPKLATPPVMEGCDASELQVIGKTYDDALKVHAQDASGAAAVRVFRTGDPVTQDMRSDRLNLELGPDGQVVSARCF